MSRALKLLPIVGGSVVAPIAVAVVAFLWLALGSSADEVARVQAPQGEIEAVLVETNGGATTSFGYEVFVVPRGTKKPSYRVARLYGAVRNSNAYGANLRWSSATELLVEFEQAKTSELERPIVTVSGRSIRVTLQPGVTDPLAPPGGMHFNLRGRV